MHENAPDKRHQFTFIFKYSTDPHSAAPVKRTYDRIFTIAYQRVMERKNKTDSQVDIIK